MVCILHANTDSMPTTSQSDKQHLREHTLLHIIITIAIIAYRFKQLICNKTLCFHHTSGVVLTAMRKGR